jgi:hypothetical protein
MGEEKIHSLYLQRKDTSSHGPSAYPTVPYAHAYEYASMRTSTHLAIRHVYKPQQPDFEALARDIQNQALRRVGTVTTEARHFREFFGTSVLVVKKTWELLERDSLLPEGGRPKHLLWALHFMKVYPKQSPGCLTVGASAGAVDPKTHRKWV